MRIISRKALLEFSSGQNQAERPLDAWYRIAKQASWANIVEVREVYPHADLFEEFTIFNISGKKYRLITEINYKWQKIYIRDVLTHAEYNKGDWKT